LKALQKDIILVYQREGWWIISGSDKQLLAAQEDTEVALYNASATLTARETFNTQWSLYVPPVFIFKNPTFCPHSVFMWFVWI
jgi:hypothetical protein